MKNRYVVFAILVLLLLSLLGLCACNTGYTINFDTNGGEEMEPIVFKDFGNVSYEDIVPQKEGYIFGGWYLDNETFTQPVENNTWEDKEKTIYAKWLKSVSVQVLANNEIMGNVTGSVENEAEGRIIEVSAVANYGYEFVGWYEGDICLSNEPNFGYTLHETLILYGVFKSKEFTLSVTSNVEGFVSGTNSYIYLSQVSLTAQEFSNKIFGGWYENETLLATDIIYTFTMEKDIVLFAKYHDVCTLSVACDEKMGSVSGGGLYNTGDVVTLTATSNYGYEFVGWYIGDELVSAEANYTKEVGNVDVSFVAKFAAVKFTLDTSSNHDEYINASDGSYDYLSEVILIANTIQKAVFKGWYLGEKEISTLSTCAVSVVADASYRAEYIFLYDLNVVSEDESKGFVSGSQSNIMLPSTITITATPNYGYLFDGWYEGDVKVSGETTCQYTMPCDDITVTAKFYNDTFTYSLVSEMESFIEDAGTIKYLDILSLSATDISGMVFAGWFDGESLVSRQPNYNYVIKKDVVLTATYDSKVQPELLEYPTAATDKLDITLKEVALCGGAMNVSGSFYWEDSTQEVKADKEYIVVFSPDYAYYTDRKFLLKIDILVDVLDIPTASLSGNVIKWGAVENATGYKVVVNNNEYSLEAEKLSYALPLENGDYYVRVRAVGDGTNHLSSDYGDIIYYTPTPSYKVNYNVPTSDRYNGTYILDADSEVDFVTDTEDDKYGVSDPISFTYENNEIVGSFSIDVLKHVKAETKKEVIKEMGISSTLSKNMKILLTCKVVMHNVVVQYDIDTMFFVLLQNLGFNISYDIETELSVDIILDGEFTDPETRRGSMSLLSMVLTGLSEPLYEYTICSIKIPKTPLKINVGIGFDAVGAVAASLNMECKQSYSVNSGIYIIQDGRLVFRPYTDVSATGADVNFNIAGETDVDINFLFISATLAWVTEKSTVSLVRLSADILDLETDLSGEAGFVSNVVNDNNEMIGSFVPNTDVSGFYRFYGQVSFEYYIDLTAKFKYIPIGCFEIKLDGSYILAEWTYAKGGIPKTPYKDSAASQVTSIYATDGLESYYKDVNNTLLKSDSDFNTATQAALIGSEEIVDIDNFYVYLLTDTKLIRVGRTSGSRRTIKSNVSRVVGSDSSYIYYTATSLVGRASETNVIRKIYRSDFDAESVGGDDLVLTRLPTGWEAISLRYDYAGGYTVIYAMNGNEETFFTLNDGYLHQHGINEYKYWQRENMGNNMTAYYRKDKDGNVKDCIMEYEEFGISHCESFLSLGFSPLGIFMVKEKTGGAFPYELVLYTVEDGQIAYKVLGEIQDKDSANRIAHYNNNTYITDLSGAHLRILKTDGGEAKELKSLQYLPSAISGTIHSEIHDSWLFVYDGAKGKAITVAIMELNTLSEKPYCVDGYIKVVDRADIQDVTFTINQETKIESVFINGISEETFKALDATSKDAKEKIEKVKKLLSNVTDKANDIEFDNEEFMRLLVEYNDVYTDIMDFLGIIAYDSQTITIPKELLSLYKYGTYVVYIITEDGIVTTNIKVTDSRTPSIDSEIITYYKDLLQSVDKTVMIYDNDYTLEGLTKNKDYLASEDGYGKLVITLLPYYLNKQAYGEKTVKVIYGGGDELEFKVNIATNWSPADSTYQKYFDKSFPNDISFSFNLYDEKYIKSVDGDVKLSDYFISDNSEVLTFYSYLYENKTCGEYIYTVTTAEKSFDVKVVVMQSVIATVEGPSSYDLGSDEAYIFSYEGNDAVSYALYFDGRRIPNDDICVNLYNGRMSISNAYFEEYAGYGDKTIAVITSYYSSDLHIATEYINFNIYDSRTPTISTTYVKYTDTEDMNDFAIYAKFYDDSMSGIYTIIDGAKQYITYYIRRYSHDYLRGGDIVISGRSVMSYLEEGKSYKLYFSIGSKDFELELDIEDMRKPCVSRNTSYCINSPSNQIYLIYMYGEKFLELTGQNITVDDYELIELDSSVYWLSIDKDFIGEMEPKDGDVIKLHAAGTENGSESNVNKFDIEIYCYTVSNNGTIITLPKPGDFPSISIPHATKLTVTPNEYSFDKGNPSDLVFNIDYGKHNTFGKLLFANRTVSKKYYTINGSTLTIKKEYLSSLSYGSNIFTAEGKWGWFTSDSFIINVVDSREPSLDSNTTVTFERYHGNDQHFDGLLYDSKVVRIEIDNVIYTSGFSTIIGYKDTIARVILTDNLLKKVAIGTRPIYLYFDDTDVVQKIKLSVTDNGLYLNETEYIDKAAGEAEKMINWTLYTGTISASSLINAPFDVVSCNNSGVVFTGFGDADYGTYKYQIKANGYTFNQKIVIYDSRKPTIANYVYDKGAQEYTLDPAVAINYDLEVVVELYDESIYGLDICTNQTIYGSGIDYSGYRVDYGAGKYYIDYIYLYRLPIGVYTYNVKTTDGTVQFNIEVIDSKKAVLLCDNPKYYDYAQEEGISFEMNLFGVEVNSISFLDEKLQNYVSLESGYHFEKSTDGNDVLVISRGFIEENCQYDGQYHFKVNTLGREEALDIVLLVTNGIPTPTVVKFVYTDVKNGLPLVAEMPEAQYLYTGDCVVEPNVTEPVGFEFIGWYTQKKGGELYDFSTPITEGQDDFFLFMRWKGKDYTITLMSEDEVFATKSVAYLSDIPTFDIPTRDGYIFYRWKEHATDTARFSMKEMPMRDITLYAEWKILEFTVTFKNFNGLTISEQKVTAHGNAVPPTEAEMVYENHTFVGWNGSYQDVLSNCILKPIYTTPTYTITYNLDGGTNSSSNPTVYDVDSWFTLSSPVKLGYTFLGWYTEETLTTQIKGINPGTQGNLVLYASWRANTYTISYDGNAPYEALGKVSGTIEKTTHTYDNASCIANIVLMLEGYSFNGWSTQKNGVKTYESGAEVVNLTAKDGGNITLFAVWQAITYDVEFVPNVPSSSSSTISGGTCVVTLTYNTDWELNVSYVLPGYRISGWSYCGKAYGLEDKLLNLTSTLGEKVYVNVLWTPVHYNIAFDASGGRGTMNSITDVEYDAEISLAANAFTKNGYTYAGGWSLTAGGTKVIDDSACVKNFATTDGVTVTLYAVWTPITYNIKYNMNEGTNNTANPSTYSTGKAISLLVPEREGYSFEGWYTDEALTMKFGGIKVSTYGDIELYAAWIQREIDLILLVDNTSSYLAWYSTYISKFSTALLNSGVIPHWTLITYASSATILEKDKDIATVLDTFSKVKKNSLSGGTAFIDAVCLGKEEVSALSTRKQVYVAITDRAILSENNYGVESISALTDALIDISASVFVAASGSVQSYYSDIISRTAGGFINYLSLYYLQTAINNLGKQISGMIREYQVSFDGGEEVTVQYASKLPEHTAPTKDHYIFKGYYIDDVCYYDGSMKVMRSWDYQADGNLTAKWQAIDYQMQFFADGVELTELGRSYNMDSVFTLPTATKTGYKFIGWYADTELTNRANEEISGTFGNKVYYAKFAPIGYTISFNADGGSGSVESQEATFDSFAYLNKNAFTKLGYTFGGWSYGDNTYEDEAKVYNLVNKECSVIMTAIWIPKTYKVTLVGGASQVMTVNFGAMLPTCVVPGKDGNNFIGYYDSVSGGKQYLNSDGIGVRAWDKDSDANLFACFEPIEYSITYILSGGTNASENKVKYTIESPTLTLNDAVRYGYIFNGWYLDEAHTEVITKIASGSMGEFTLYADWQGLESVVTLSRYPATDGTKFICAVFGSDMPSVICPTRAGFKFNGYYNGTNGTGRQYYSESGESLRVFDETESITLYAYWTCINYDITYHMDGGDNSLANPTTYTIDDDVVFIAPQKVGFVFGGWYSDAEFTHEIDSIPIGSYQNYDIYAKWIALNYTITLDWRKEDNVKEVLTAEFGENMPLATQNSRYGYTLLGFYTNTESSGTKYYNEDMSSAHVWDIAADTTLYACWELTKFAVSYNLFGGTNSTVNPVSYNTFSGTIVLSNPTRTGYNFEGWYEDEEFATAISAIVGAEQRDLNLYAKWNAKQYTVTLNPGDGEGGTNNIVATYDSLLGEAEAPTRAGYAFVGYYYSTVCYYDGDMNPIKAWNLSRNETLTAKWEANTYTITLDTSNLTSVSYTQKQVKYNSSYSIAVPTKTGYTFLGWYDENSVQYTSAAGKSLAKWTDTSDLTIYPDWAAKNYSITFDKQSGSGGTASITVTFDAAITAPCSAPEREGYTFEGYWTGKKGTGTYIFDASMVSQVTTWTIASNTTLYAKWKGLDYTVVLDKQFGDTYSDEQGNYVYFGTYPQTKITDTGLTASLNTQAGTLPTSSDSGNWTSYNYYISSDNSTDYMWYIDVEYNGNEYRGVYFTKYRPYSTGDSSTTSNTSQDENGYYIDSIYWFEYEPVKWRILTEDSDSFILFVDMIIDSQNFAATVATGKSENNYAYSTIRTWLNDTFYSTCFSELQKSLIQTVTVVNSAASTNLDEDADYYNNGVNKYASENTEDKVWLLSVQEISKASYGFGAGDVQTIDATRYKAATDYAKCQGSYTFSNGTGIYWLRSPWYSASSTIYAIRGEKSSNTCHGNQVGTAPAIKIYKHVSIASQLAPQEFNGNTYELIQINTTWSNAKAYCENLGGHLATITSAEEQQFICDNLIGKLQCDLCWIGGYKSSDIWYWVTGEEFAYTNWAENEPNNENNNEWCLQILNTHNNSFGYWNDNCDTDAHYFICEWESQNGIESALISAMSKAKEYNGHSYAYINKQMTWTSAKEYCESLGGHLATLTDDAENSWVANNIVNKYAWFGLYEKSYNNWVWVTGEISNYTNWASGEPNNSGGNENYGGYYSVPGQWNDFNNSASTVDGLICEWDFVLDELITRSESSTSEITVTYGSSMPFAVKPTRLGYVFKGYYDGKNGTGTCYYNANMVSQYVWKQTNGLTLYAYWTPQSYSISYTTLSGATHSNSTSYNIETSLEFADASCAGYVFAGWFLDKDCTKQITAILPGTVGNLVLYSKWNLDTYDVTLDFRGGEGGAESVTATYTQLLPIDIVAPAKLGYTFAGYYSKVNGAGNCYYDSNMIPQIAWQITAGGTLYVNWIANTYQAIYTETDTYTVSATQKSVTYESDFTLHVPTKKGYHFMGWYSDAKQISRSDGASIEAWSVAGDLELTAHWEAGEYTLTIDSLGGSTGVSTIAISYDDAMPTGIIKVPTKDYYTFGGYWTAEGGAGRLIYNVDMTPAIETWNIDGDSTIYAWWKPYDYAEMVSSGIDAQYTGDYGDCLYFGKYPQTQVIDAGITAALTAKAGTLPTNGNNQDWTSYKYYIGASNSVDFMWFIDIEYQNELYRGVYFTSYRPSYSKRSANEDGSYLDDNGYYVGNVYWFRYDPIKWRIYSISEGNAFLMSDMALDGIGIYYDVYNIGGNAVRTIDGKTVYANNYEYSDIRAWLNTTFYNASFSEEQKEYVRTTLVDNSMQSTLSQTDAEWVCSDTRDKVFLLSYEEVVNGPTCISSKESRIIETTDYAKAQGASNESWWLRSPSKVGTIHSWNLLDGSLHASNGNDDNAIATVPAIIIKYQCIGEHSYANDNPCQDKYCVYCGGGYLKATAEHVLDKDCKCSVCGDVCHGEEQGDYCRHNNEIYLGSYPQSAVVDRTILKNLNLLAGDVPTSADAKTWNLYDYDCVEENTYMWYKDVTMSGEKYRGVYMTGYRSESNYQPENGYVASDVIYWFRYEPIKWRMLDEESGETLILAELILDSQSFNSASASNDYADSSIRNWLNSVFYATAFNDLQRNLIAVSTVKCDADSMGLKESEFASETVYDKVFLLSAQDATNISYGFSSDIYASSVRTYKCTDYAKSQDARVYLDGCWWWLRSAGDTAGRSRVINYEGYYSYADVQDLTCGVVPAMRIKLNATDVGIDIAISEVYSTYAGHQYRIFDQAMTWTDAKEYCEALGGHLVTINTKEEQEFIESLMTASSGEYGFWTGAFKNDSEEWQWVTDEVWQYTNWAIGQPDNTSNSEGYGEIYTWSSDFGHWNDLPHSGIWGTASIIGFICEWDDNNTKEEVIESYLNEALEYNGNKYTIITKSLTWYQAKEYCESLGGHLVTITSQAEQDFITGSFLQSSTGEDYQGYLIGAIRNDNLWSWVTGELWLYTNWESGQPDNCGSGNAEWVGQICENESRFAKWNDISGNTIYAGIINGFICEWEGYELKDDQEFAIANLENAVEYGSHSYLAIDKAVTWSAAKAYCEKIGGHLVTVTSAEEQSFLEAQFMMPSSSLWCGYYNGLYYNGSAYAWITGEDMSYSNWVDGQPDRAYNLENVGMFTMYSSNFGKWNDCYDDCPINANVNIIGFICEWDFVLDSISTGNANSEVTLTAASELSSKKPTKVGYTFAGYYSGENGTGIEYFDENLNAVNALPGSQVTIYAYWNEIDYHIGYIFAVENATHSNVDSYTISSDAITFTDATCEGYDFIGWFADSEYTKSIAVLNSGSSGNINLYAKFLPCVSVDVTVTIDDKETTYGESLAELTYQVTEGAVKAGDDLGITLTKAEGSDAGTYAITGTSSNSNYNVTFVNGTYTIAKKSVAVVWSNTSLTYTGSEQAPTAYFMDVNNVKHTLTVTGGATNVGTYTATANTSSYDSNYEFTNKTSGYTIVQAAYTREGNYIYFGSYPQSEVTDSTTKSALNTQAGTLPTESNSYGWTSYKYYISDSNSTDFMWYQDVTYNNEKYRGVYFINYRPYYTNYSSSACYNYQDNNGYTTSTVYWFKYEPIKWRILEEKDGYATVLAELILDSQAYQNEYEYKNGNHYIKGTDTYANNYAYSSIRAWLNDTFYNTAFNDLQKALIQTVEVDNSARSTNLDNNATRFNSGNNSYACANTQDKVWLLSEQEVTRESDGFATDPGDLDTVRCKQTTAYAQCQGAYTRNEGDEYDGNGRWWLRSPNYISDYRARGVEDHGDSYGNDYVNSTHGGVVAALKIKIA